MGNGKAKRDLSMDIVKGIGIILMVVGHSKSPFTAFIYSFHMPLFFIVSGYLFNIKYSESLKSSFGYMIKKLKELYIPYCVWTGIFVICNNLFVYCNIYTDNPLLLES
ncbi:MAG: acyltransferase family protein, partial [Oscillospiraceae bacterium]